ncbi:MAG: hypothetical protein V7647_3617 [Acidobacteriota bacterium]|jgi:hypothetical protein
MRTRVIGCAVAIAMSVAGAASAQGPTFAGKWKLNMAKSQLTGQTVTFEKKQNGLIHFDSQGFAYDFALDGKEHPLPDGSTTAWKQVNPTTWDSTSRVNGKVVSTIRAVVKGDSQEVTIKMLKADGTSSDMNLSLARVSGGPGFFGKWKSTEVKGVPSTLDLSVDGTTGITVKYPEMQMSCLGAFDGKDHPMMIAGSAVKQTLAFERQGTTVIKMTTKIDGKPFYTDVLTLSTDGKTLTDDGMPASANEPSKAVYEKQ